MVERKRLVVSHVTVSQSARFVGVSQAAAWKRVSSGKMVVLDVLGTPMVSADDCRRWLRERRKAARTNGGAR